MQLLLAASGLENLITLLVLVGLALATLWLKRKQQTEEDSEPWTPPATSRPSQAPPRQPSTPSQAPPPPKTLSWEEELRRLLEGEPVESAPPPVIVRPAPQPISGPPPLPRPQPVPERRVEPQPATVESVTLAELTQSAEAYRKASRLDRKVEEHLRGIEERVATHVPVRSLRRTFPEREKARALLRNRESIRAAIIASTILGPPKASAS